MEVHHQQEVRHCRYYDVEAFFEKYFDRADWLAREDEVFDAAETCRRDALPQFLWTNRRLGLVLAAAEGFLRQR